MVARDRDRTTWVYVGISFHPQRRFYEHIATARANRHLHVARWIRGLLIKNLRPELLILEMVPRWKGLTSEHKWAVKFRRDGMRLTNETEAKTDDSGLFASLPERSQKISRAMKGRKLSPEHCAKIGAAHKGKTVGLRQRQRQSVAMKRCYVNGMVPWNKGKKGMQVAWNKGKRTPAAQCLKMSIAKKRLWQEDPEFRRRALIGIVRSAEKRKGRAFSVKHRASLVAAWTRRPPCSDATREKRRIAATGKTPTLETRKKLSESVRKSWILRKAKQA